jgi:nucleotide-binding universal stress UspA family protein
MNERSPKMKVLIALEASPRNAEIVAEMASRPWPARTSFVLLHVLDPYPFAKAPISLQRAKADAELQLKNAAKRLCSEGWNTDERVVLGRARQRIAKIAAALKADLVVVGSHDVGGLTRLLLGSTARAVLRHAPCSVEIVRPEVKQGISRKGRGMRVLIATDGSECSTAALRGIARRPWPDGSLFRVISIPEPFMPLSEFPQFEMTEIERLNTEAIKDATRYAKVGAAILRKAGLDAETDTPFPRETDAREIVKEAERWHAGMIVLGSHGRRGFARWTIGSVSEHVALHAPCSVQVIRGFSSSTVTAKQVRKKE